MKNFYAVVLAVVAISLIPLVVHAQSSDDVLKDTPEFFLMKTGVLPYWSSPNGRFCWFSDQGKVTIYDRVVDQTWEYGDGITEIYSIGQIGNDGIGGGSYQGKAAYWSSEKGWTVLPGSKDGTHKGAMVNVVSSDGKMMCGRQENYVSGKTYFADQAARVPIVWEQKADGTWSEYEVLPSYNEDYGGRCPQGFDVLLISDNNSVLSGRFISASGFIQLPIVYKRDSKGKWQLKVYGEDWIVNEGAKKPVHPRYQPVEPDVTTFMSESEKANYQEDLKAFNDSVAAYIKDVKLPYPKYDPKKHYQDYFETETTEGAIRWNNYAEAYQLYREEATQYNDSLKTYTKDEAAYFRQDRRFSIGAINYIRMSGNGRYIGVQSGLIESGTTMQDIKMYSQPGLFDLETGEFTFPVIKDLTEYMINSVMDNGSLLYKPKNLHIDFVLPKGASEHIPLEQYIQGINKKAYEDLEAMNVNGTYVLGYVQCDGKGEKFHSFAYDKSYGGYMFWYMDLAKYNDVSIGQIIESEKSVELYVAENTLFVKGIEKGKLSLFDLAGKQVLNGAVESTPISLNGLNGGIYIAKVYDGTQTHVRKICIAK